MVPYWEGALKPGTGAQVAPQTYRVQVFRGGVQACPFFFKAPLMTHLPSWSVRGEPELGNLKALGSNDTVLP